jgi:autophagy-related protein 5
VPLKWHLPLGLLHDIYALSSLDPDSSAPAPLPFTLVVHFSPSPPSAPPGALKPTVSLISPTPPVLHDSFINAVKEADFLRSGTAKPIMSLSAADSKALWSSVQTHDQDTYCRIQNALLPPPGQFRNIPLRVYLPSGPEALDASIKVLQSHVPPTIPASSTTSTPSGRIGSTAGPPQTVGTTLHTLLPNLFPSRRTPVLARPVLHGAMVPMSSPLEELARCAAYADGWLSVVVVMNT